MDKLKKSKKETGFKKGRFYKCFDAHFTSTFIGEYIGKEEGYECMVCHKGNSAYGFNIYYSDKANNVLGYETFFYGKEHLPQKIEEMPKLKTKLKEREVYLKNGETALETRF